MIRNASPADFPHILRLNSEWEHFLSPLDASRLSWLHSLAVYHRVVEYGDGIAAFLLGFRESACYDSPNYQWFAERYPRFLYVDRIVVAGEYRGMHHGAGLYEDLFAFARRANVAQVACEIDMEPPNTVSWQFHAGFGFNEVGTQRIAEGRKRVSLQIATA